MTLHSLPLGVSSVRAMVCVSSRACVRVPKRACSRALSCVLLCARDVPRGLYVGDRVETRTCVRVRVCLCVCARGGSYVSLRLGAPRACACVRAWLKQRTEYLNLASWPHARARACAPCMRVRVRMRRHRVFELGQLVEQRRHAVDAVQLAHPRLPARETGVRPGRAWRHAEAAAFTFRPLLTFCVRDIGPG